MGDHTEIIQIDYDPKIVSYEELLNLARAQGDFIGMPFSRQYRSVVLYHNEQQRKAAQRVGIQQLEPFRKFTRAEDYHQKYYLQQSAVAKDFYKRYPDAKSFTDSTAATRANGIVGGYVDSARLKELVPDLGVTQKSESALYKMAGKAPKGCAISP
jgi:hypothetical protein